MEINKTFSVIKNNIAFVFLVILLLLNGCSRSLLTEHVFQGTTMGTSFTIKVVTSGSEAMDEQALQQDIYRLLKAVNMQMSTYIDSSDISLFNQHQNSDWFPVSPELVSVVSIAIMVSEKSDGAFDVTVGPLVNLWGFGPEYRTLDLPDADEIARRKAQVGFKKLGVDTVNSALRKTNPALYLDLSAIAKGYGVDVVADFLQDRGYANFLVEIGGEIRAHGHNSKTKKWRIGIASPNTGPDFVKVMSVENVGVATSGDYQNYFERDGVRYSHTIDPRTGRPITHKLASVTVAHPACQLADAYATAISVLGPEKGYEFALQQGLLVFMVIREGEGFVEKMTPGFESLISLIDNR